MLRRDDEFTLLPIRNPQSAIRNQRRVQIVSAESRITVRGKNLEDALIQFEDGNVERASAKVVHGDFCTVAEFIEAVGEGRGGGFVEDALDVA